MRGSGARFEKCNTHLGWAVNRRALAQKLLHDLYDHLDKNPGFPYGDNAKWKPMARLVDATYSLWRSAFLTKVERDKAQIFNHTKKYLEKILQTNTVTFVDDYLNSELTVGYYMSNARYRIERMYNKETDQKLLELPSIQKIYKMRDGDIDTLNAQDLWDDLYCALEDCATYYGFIARTPMATGKRPRANPIAKAKNRRR